MIPSISQSGQISLTSLGRQELDLDADRLGDARVIFVLVHPVARAREADVGDLAKADVEPGLLLRASGRARPNICGSARPNSSG